MAAFYENGVGTEEGKKLAEDLAERFKVTVEEALRVLKEGTNSLAHIITSEFTAKELSELTEGYLP